VLAKRSLVRVVRTPEGVAIDPTSKAPGRGAYVHDRRECWEAAFRGGLARALRTELSANDRHELEMYVSTLPDGPSD
jgi:predicted RNA-binding protein YlxR (DUF448 family)